MWRLCVLLALVATLLGGLIWWLLRPGDAPPPPLTAARLSGLRGYVDQPALSPDGSRVAFISNREERENIDVYVKPVGGGAVVRLTTHPAVECSPAWSPDGRWIAFLRAARGSFQAPSDVVMIPASGGPERKVAEVNVQPDWYFLPGPFLAWAPDATAVVVCDRGLPEEPAGLFWLSVETGSKQRLTTPPFGAPGDSGPAFSPDGRTLAFARFRGFGVSDIYVLPLTVALTPERDAERRTYENRFSAMPAWTPDGKEIVYSSWSGEGYVLHRVKSGGPEVPETLGNAGQGGTYPALSARARRLVYVRSTDGENIRGIQLAGMGGQAREYQPPINSERFDGFPDFSPDGKRIAFTSARSGSLEIWSCASEGGECAQLTSLKAGFTGFPRWSPDGEYLAFFSNVEGQNEVFIIPAGGGRPRRLTDDPADDILPAWSRNGDWIYFASARTGRYQVWKVEAAGSLGSPAQVTLNGGFAACESSDGKALYYSKDRRFLTSLWRMSVASGGREAKAADSVLAGGFAAAEQGLYCLIPTPNSWLGASLQYLGAAGGKPRLVMALQKPVQYGLSVAPDGRTLVFTAIDRAPGELLLVENFR